MESCNRYIGVATWVGMLYLLISASAQAQMLVPGEFVTMDEPGVPTCSAGDPTMLTFCRWDPATESAELLVSAPLPPNTFFDTGDSHHFAMDTNFEPERHTIFVTARRFIPNEVNTGQLFEVDVATGTLTVVAEDLRLFGASGVALEANGDLIVSVLGSAPNPIGEPAVLRINRENGNIDILSQGDLIGWVTGAPTIRPNGDILVASRHEGFEGTGEQGIIQVDPATGAQSVLVPNQEIQSPTSVHAATDGDLYVGKFGGMYRVDGETLQGTVLWGPNDTGFSWFDVDVESDGTILAVSDVLPILMRWDPNSGEPAVPFFDMIGFARSVELVSPECSDGLDNNHDGVFDYPDDPWCASSADNREGPGRCGLGFEVAFLLAALGWKRRNRER